MPRTRRLTAARLGPRDVLHVGSAGLRSRPVRVVLSALGIAIGIATMIAVVGISASSQAQLLRQLDALGTNMLVAKPGEGMFSGQEVKLPKDAVGMVGRIEGVEEAAGTGDLRSSVRRSEKIPEAETGGIAVKAATEDEAKLSVLDPAADVTGVRAALRAVEGVCLGGDAAGQAAGDDAGRRFRWLIAPRSTVVQPGPVHTGLTADPEAEVERLLDLLVR
ncbi:DUF3037 domain-containing protein [Streptomyces massasporeus]